MIITMKRSELFFNALMVPLDYLSIVFSIILIYSLRFLDPVKASYPVLYSLDFWQFVRMTLLGAAFVVLVYAIEGLYSMKVTRSLLKEFIKIFSSTSTALLIIILVAFVNRDFFSSRFILIGSWLSIIFFVSWERFLVRFIQTRLAKSRGVGVHRVLIIGEGEISDKIIKFFRQKKSSPYKLVARIKEIEEKKMDYYARKVDEIIYCNPETLHSKITPLVRFCEANRIDFKYVPNLFSARATNIEVRNLAGFPVVEIKRTPLDGWGRVMKRFYDFTGSLILLTILSPLFAILAIIIKLDSPGPVFARLKRVSQGREFKMLKFRSMVKDAHKKKKELMKFNERKDGPLFKMANDPRITKFGRFLRRTRLDEFAQLINVIKGEMSLVGPRPHEPEEIENYKIHHKKVLGIKAGITGMAQVSGSSGLNFEDEVGLDTYYIENWSLTLDLIILFKTLVIVLRGDKDAV